MKMNTVFQNAFQKGKRILEHLKITIRKLGKKKGRLCKRPLTPNDEKKFSQMAIPFP
tara:strand:- start:326 stop:496 length:171 start_codon:yes stop_codon:yes gene_type:complete